MQNTKLLLILDGWGYSSSTENNAIALANTPNWDHLVAKYPNTLIGTSGASVGLPDGQMGNSEVGHLTIGSGRLIEQDFTRIENDIESGEFFKNSSLCQALNDTNKNDFRYMVTWDVFANLKIYKFNMKKNQWCSGKICRSMNEFN